MKNVTHFRFIQKSTQLFGVSHLIYNSANMAGPREGQAILSQLRIVIKDKFLFGISGWIQQNCPRPFIARYQGLPFTHASNSNLKSRHLSGNLKGS